MAKIDILISTNGNLGNGSSPIDGSSNLSVEEEIIAPKKDSNILARSVYVNQLANAGISTLKNVVNFAKSNYGNFTGDYIGQQKIDNVFGAANTMVSLGGSIVSGAMVGGIPGAVVGAVIGTVNIGVTAWQNNVNYKTSITKTNYASSFNSQRIGVVLTDGNR